ncbi:MAG TPA: hypothetical protein PK263_01535, partial [bacterium]|nr:hypothetical protein [bacterium]
YGKGRTLPLRLQEYSNVAPAGGRLVSKQAASSFQPTNAINIGDHTLVCFRLKPGLLIDVAQASACQTTLNLPVGRQGVDSK